MSPQDVRSPTPGSHRYFVVALLGAFVGVLLGIALAPTILPEILPHLTEPQIPYPEEDTPGGEEIPNSDEAQEEPMIIFPAIEEMLVSTVRDVGPSVVGITSRKRVTDPWGRRHAQDNEGSGIVIDGKDGNIVTNYHVIEDAHEIIVETADDQEYTAQIVGEDPPTDLAVLQVETDDRMQPLSYGDSDSVVPGQLAIAIGNPLGREFARSVTLGVVSGIRASMYGQDARQRVFQLIQTDASINPGNSGGALLNSQGELIGINTLKFARPEVEGMGFAIPSNTVKRIVDELIKKGEVTRSWMGVSLISAQDAREEGADVDTERGVYLARVVSQSPADQGGLREGDVVVGLDDVELKEVVDLLAELELRSPGDAVTFQFVRDGDLKTTEVVLGTMPQ